VVVAGGVDAPTLQRLSPDVAIVDLMMPWIDGWCFAARLRDDRPSPRRRS
jgi:CheY-like chemotaxis protein